MIPLGSPRLAGLFPGQGSQFSGMARELRRMPRGVDLLRQAETASGLPLEEILDRGSSSEMAHPAVAQLAIFTHSVASYDLWCRRAPAPSVVAGHSIGEYAAMVAAAMLPVERALELVNARGRLMARAADRTEGAMGAVVGLPLEELRSLCSAAAAQPVVVANHNSPRQLVVSGSAAGVDEVLAAAASAGALRSKRLTVGGAYHSPLMYPADEAMSELWQDTLLHDPAPGIVLVSSRTGEVVRTANRQHQLMRGQVAAPVRWDRVMTRLLKLGVQDVVEHGPGKVLRGLAREQTPQLRLLAQPAPAADASARPPTGVLAAGGSET